MVSEYESYLLPQFKIIVELIKEGNLDGLKAREEFIRANIDTPIDTKFNNTFLLAAIFAINPVIVTYLLQQPGININKIISYYIRGPIKTTVLDTSLYYYCVYDRQKHSEAFRKDFHRIILELILNGADLFMENVISRTSKKTDDALINLIQKLRAFEKAKDSKKDSLADEIANLYTKLNENTAAQRWREYKSVKKDYTKLLSRENQKFELCYSKFITEHDNVIKTTPRYLAGLKPEEIGQSGVTLQMLFDANMEMGYLCFQKVKNYYQDFSHAIKTYFSKALKLSTCHTIEVSSADKLFLQACSEYRRHQSNEKMLFSFGKAAKENSAAALNLLKFLALDESCTFSQRILSNFLFQSVSGSPVSNSAIFKPDSEFLKGLKLLYGIGCNKNPQEAITIFSNIEKNHTRQSDLDMRKGAQCCNMRAHHAALAVFPEAEAEITLDIIKIVKSAIIIQIICLDYSNILLDVAESLQSNSRKTSIIKAYLEVYRCPMSLKYKKIIYNKLASSKLITIPEILDKLLESVQEEYRCSSGAKREFALDCLRNLHSRGLGSECVEAILARAKDADINTAIECYREALQNAKTSDDSESIFRQVTNLYLRAHLFEAQKQNLEKIILETCELHNISSEIFRILRSNNRTAFLSNATTVQLIQMIYSDYEKDEEFLEMVRKHSEALNELNELKEINELDYVYAKAKLTAVEIPLPIRHFPMLNVAKQGHEAVIPQKNEIEPGSPESESLSPASSYKGSAARVISTFATTQQKLDAGMAELVQEKNETSSVICYRTAGLFFNSNTSQKDVNPQASSELATDTMPQLLPRG